MAQAGRLNRIGSMLAPVSNWMARWPGAGWIAARAMGIDPRRPLPHFERNHFRKWFRKRMRTAVPAARARGPIVLLDDCLTSYGEPQVNRAAVEVLEAAGYEVHLAGLECCGRTYASKGLLSHARRFAAQNIARLLPWANRGIPIVGCEPSCLLMLVDEYLDLVPGEDALTVAHQAELVDSHLRRIGVNLPLRPLQQEVVLHGHCHQKALVGAQDTLAMLGTIPESSVRQIDSGCCGMAGSFGYEHYDLSMAIGERVLFPAVRAAPGAVVIAPGFSCRQQIAHGTARAAVHPVQLLAAQLES